MQQPSRQSSPFSVLPPEARSVLRALEACRPQTVCKNKRKITGKKVLKRKDKRRKHSLYPTPNFKSRRLVSTRTHASFEDTHVHFKQLTVEAHAFAGRVLSENRTRTELCLQSERMSENAQTSVGAALGSLLFPTVSAFQRARNSWPRAHGSTGYWMSCTWKLCEMRSIFDTVCARRWPSGWIVREGA